MNQPRVRKVRPFERVQSALESEHKFFPLKITIAFFEATASS